MIERARLFPGRGRPGSGTNRLGPSCIENVPFRWYEEARRLTGHRGLPLEFHPDTLAADSSIAAKAPGPAIPGDGLPGQFCPATGYGQSGGGQPVNIRRPYQVRPTFVLSTCGIDCRVNCAKTKRRASHLEGTGRLRCPCPTPLGRPCGVPSADRHTEISEIRRSETNLRPPHRVACVNRSWPRKGKRPWVNW